MTNDMNIQEIIVLDRGVDIQSTDFASTYICKIC